MVEESELYHECITNVAKKILHHMHNNTLTVITTSIDEDVAVISEDFGVTEDEIIQDVARAMLLIDVITNETFH